MAEEEKKKNVCVPLPEHEAQKLLESPDLILSKEVNGCIFDEIRHKIHTKGTLEAMSFGDKPIAIYSFREEMFFVSNEEIMKLKSPKK